MKNRTKDISSFERIPKNLNKNQNKKTIQSIPVVDLICTFVTILIPSVNKLPTNIDFSNERVTILPEERVEEVWWAKEDEVVPFFFRVDRDVAIALGPLFNRHSVNNSIQNFNPTSY